MTPIEKRFRAELWEIQVILYWILARMLFDKGHDVLGWVVTGYTLFAVAGTIGLLLNARAADGDL